MSKKVVPDFYGVLEVTHYIKGRIRVKIYSLISDEEKCKELENTIGSLDGIEEIKCNSTIGTVLVKFNEEIVSPVVLVGAILNVLELEEEAFSVKSGKTTNFLKELISSVDSTIYNKTRGIGDLKSLIALLCIIYGVKKIRQNPVLPNGINLLWWGFSLLSRGGN